MPWNKNYSPVINIYKTKSLIHQYSHYSELIKILYLKWHTQYCNIKSSFDNELASNFTQDLPQLSAAAWQIKFLIAINSDTNKSKQSPARQLCWRSLVNNSIQCKISNQSLVTCSLVILTFQNSFQHAK